MKYIVVICLAVFALANAQDDKKVVEECKKTSGWGGNWREEKETPEVKAFQECILKKFEIIKKDGTLDKQKALDNVDKMGKLNPEQKAKAKEISSKCVDQVKPSSDSRETAYKLFTCFHQQMKG